MKGKSIIDAVAAFTVLQLILIIPVGVRDLVRWENRALGGSYLTGLLFVALPVFVIIVRRYEFRLMGITSEDWRKSINNGYRGWLFFIVPQLIMTFFNQWGLRYQDYPSLAVILSILVLAVCVLMNRGEFDSASDRRLVLIALFLVIPICMSFVGGFFSWRLMKEFIWNIAVGGFAEEFFYRGYIQSSINQEYTREWKLGKTSFGPGLIVSAILYGISRGIRVMRPWSGVYDFAWGWGFYAFTLGLFYGLIREASGDILASGTANSMIDAIGRVLLRAIS
jgi:membrane protease YdiL (CAAX protease family)